MRRAFSTLGCPELALEPTLELALRRGIDGVELRVLEGRLDLPALLAERYGSPAALASRLGPRSSRIVSFSTSLALPTAGPAERDAFLAHVPWAEALGVRWLRVFDGAAPTAAAGRRETLGWWREVRRSGGWSCDVMVETHDSLVTGDAIAAFATETGGTAILWDSFVTWFKGGEDPLRTWEVVRPHVRHVHVKDALRRPTGDHPWTYVAPGTGEFPFAALLALLEKDRFAGMVGLEWERQWHPYLGPLEAALMAAELQGWR